MLKIGVTGTRSGMNEYQRHKVYKFLKEITNNGGSSFQELHHGDCVGVDVQVAQMAKEFNFKIICHPPEKNELRGYFISDHYKIPLSYFARNRNIVDECDILLVVPYQTEWQKVGGTWYTHDYAKKKKKQIVIFWPEVVI